MSDLGRAEILHGGAVGTHNGIVACALAVFSAEISNGIVERQGEARSPAASR